MSCPAPSGSVFLGQQSSTLRLPTWQAVRHWPGAHPEDFRGQKTFSAGPRSFNAEEFWFPGSYDAAQAQPVVDSRHGRITCKAAFLTAF